MLPPPAPPGRTLLVVSRENVTWPFSPLSASLASRTYTGEEGVDEDEEELAAR